MMISLPQAFVRTMRDHAESLMTDTCTIEVQANSYGEMGELLSESYDLVAEGVVCRVIDATGVTSSEVEMQSNRETIVGESIIVTPYATALDVDQRITTSDGTQWQVTALITSRTTPVDAQAVVTRIHG